MIWTNISCPPKFVRAGAQFLFDVTTYLRKYVPTGTYLILKTYCSYTIPNSSTYPIIYAYAKYSARQNPKVDSGACDVRLILRDKTLKLIWGRAMLGWFAKSISS